MIDITIKRLADPDTGSLYYEVKIGPDGHVCQDIQKFWVQNHENDVDLAWQAANAYKRGAYAAITVASGLTCRFLSPNIVEE